MYIVVVIIVMTNNNARGRVTHDTIRVRSTDVNGRTGTTGPSRRTTDAWWWCVPAQTTAAAMVNVHTLTGGRPRRRWCLVAEVTKWHHYIHLTVQPRRTNEHKRTMRGAKRRRTTATGVRARTGEWRRSLFFFFSLFFYRVSVGHCTALARSPTPPAHRPPAEKDATCASFGGGAIDFLATANPTVERGRDP